MSGNANHDLAAGDGERLRGRRGGTDEGLAPATIVFISYGSFDGNSATHIAGFANGLCARGHAVAVCSAGHPSDSYRNGAPRFEPFSIEELMRDPEAVAGFDGRLSPERTILICWTPREIVRRAAAPLIDRFGLRYIVHMEDNEEHLTQVNVRQRTGLLGRKQPFPVHFADPERLAGFLAGAAGITVIEERLKEMLPPGPPAIVLEPGIELDAFARPLPPARNATIRRAIGVPAEAILLVYPGNVHRANAEEVSRLYEALDMLRKQSKDVWLARTGTDHLRSEPELTQRLASQAGVVTLGQVSRSFLIDLLKCADALVQPGAPGPFNDYRLPSKLPEFMAAAKPVVLPATNVGRRLRHGTDALLLQDGSAAEIARHVAAIMEDAELAATLSRNARDYAEKHYRWDVQVEKLEGFLAGMRSPAASGFEAVKRPT